MMAEPGRRLEKKEGKRRRRNSPCTGWHFNYAIILRSPNLLPILMDPNYPLLDLEIFSLLPMYVAFRIRKLNL